MRIYSRVTVFFLSLAVWLAITSFTDRQEIAAGVAVALLVSLIAGDLFIKDRFAWKTSRVLNFLAYLPMLAWEILKANLQVAYLVLHPRLPIRPGIVKIRTGLSSDIGLTMLANSITLTPGTMTVDLDRRNGFLYVHCVAVTSEDIEGNTARIAGKFEKRLRMIFP